VSANQTQELKAWSLHPTFSFDGRKQEDVFRKQGCTSLPLNVFPVHSGPLLSDVVFVAGLCDTPAGLHGQTKGNWGKRVVHLQWTKWTHGAFLWMREGPCSSYSLFDIHIC